MVKTLIVGLGTQGEKRAKLIKKNLVATVDPINKSANYKNIKDVPIQDYKAVFLCVPDNEKKKLINFCLKNKKHILVEKPLILSNKREYLKIQKLARKNKSFLYTAFNHLFEPHLIKLKNYLDQKNLQ